MSRLTAQERDMYEQFTREFPFCYACFWSKVSKWRTWHRPELHRAHIIGGSGRRADRRDIVMLCEGCHRLSHGATIKAFASYAQQAAATLGEDVKPIRLPNLRLDHILWLKHKLDPEHYDRNYLCEIKQVKAIPPARPTPEWHRKERARRLRRILSLGPPIDLQKRLASAT